MTDVPRPMDPVVTFRFVEFNPRRVSRGVEGARVEVLEDGVECAWLWMSAKDIRNNLAEFGESEELRKALAAYRRGTGDREVLG
jgi:hypothetical protein